MTANTTSKQTPPLLHGCKIIRPYGVSIIKSVALAGLITATENVAIYSPDRSTAWAMRQIAVSNFSSTLHCEVFSVATRRQPLSLGRKSQEGKRPNRKVAKRRQESDPSRGHDFKARYSR